MHWHRVLGRHVLTSLFVLLTLVASLAGVRSVAFAHAPATARASTGSSTAAFPAEGNKVTLGETSVDSPALWTSSTGSVRATIAWTGTDPAHHLNLLTSGDGVNWGNKVTLDETSPFRAGITRTGPNSGDSTVLAWTGTDTNRSLNVVMGNAKLTLWQESSFTGPAIATLGGNLYLVWAGTDAAHTVNVDRIATSGGSLRVTQKTTLWGWSSPAGPPTMVADPVGQRLLMSWTGPNQRVYFAYSIDGANWTQPSQSPMAELSDAAPMIFSALAADVSSALHRYFVAWRGVDPNHSVNVKYTTSFPAWPQSYAKTVLDEQSLGGPVLGSVGVGGQLILAWTGVDAAHHLNVAAVAVPYASACVPAPGVQPVMPDVIMHGTPATRVVSLTFDSDHGSAGNASAYLDILRAHQIHATFFLTSDFAQANPALVQRIVSEGHDVGNHTVDHPDLANPPRTDTFIGTELTGADGAISGIAGRSTRPYFRPPYGSYNEQVQYLAAGLGYRTILWSIDPRDWDPNTTVQDILNRVLNSPNLAPGAIILMHVNSPNEAQALDGVIVGLQQRGYTIVPLSQLLR